MLLTFPALTDTPPTPAPACLVPPRDFPPKHPEKATKPKLPPRPLSKVFSSAEHGAGILKVHLSSVHSFLITVTHLWSWMLSSVPDFTILTRLVLLQGFERFRMDETLCDVVLVPGDSDETFRVHRVIMALSSDYFKAMFTGEAGWTKGPESFSVPFSGQLNRNCM